MLFGSEADKTDLYSPLLCMLWRGSPEMIVLRTGSMEHGINSSTRHQRQIIPTLIQGVRWTTIASVLGLIFRNYHFIFHSDKLIFPRPQTYLERATYSHQFPSKGKKKAGLGGREGPLVIYRDTAIDLTNIIFPSLQAILHIKLYQPSLSAIVFVTEEKSRNDW